jgi:hypothetical protein
MAHLTSDPGHFWRGFKIHKPPFFAIPIGMAFQAFSVARIILIRIQLCTFFFQFFNSGLERLKGLSVVTDTPIQDFTFVAAATLNSGVTRLGMQRGAGGQNTATKPDPQQCDGFLPQRPFILK